MLIGKSRLFSQVDNFERHTYPNEARISQNQLTMNIVYYDSCDCDLFLQW